MHFAAPIPIWLITILVIAMVGIAMLSYRRPLAPLSSVQRGVLIALRGASLGAVFLFLLRPIVLTPGGQRDVVVPVLVDVSRSMRVVGADGLSRMANAVRLIESDLLPKLSQRFTPELYGVSGTLMAIPPTALGQIEPDGRRSDLAAAVEAVRERYRGRRISGIVLVSDGGDTTQQTSRGEATGGPPTFAIGVGERDGLRDREVLDVVAGDPPLDQASVDLHVAAVSHGYGRQPFDVQVRANGQLVESRRVTPAAEGAPMDEVFTVSPDPLVATVFTVDVAVGEGEPISENNSRSVLVSPAGRRRRMLVMQGAPGFEHGFMVRALSQDPVLEIDSVIRKGKNENGRDTFLVQATGGREAVLMQGFPSRKEDLFAYDAIVIANIEGDFFTRSQLAMMAEFVSERGGGLLVLGGRSFAQQGFMGTPLEEVLPVELNDRRGGLARAAFGVDLSAPQNTVVVTPDGEQHPVMRIASSLEETRKRWAALPPLAATAPLGGPRPGASILAVPATPGGIYPVVAVQRFGRGRSMVFGGEAAWRWRMRLPSTDRSFEFFWRQAARWLAGPAPDQVSVSVPASAEPGDTIAIAVDVRDAAFAPASDATVEATVTMPGGATQPMTMRREGTPAGPFAATMGVEQPGLYRVHAEARRRGTVVGAADRWFYVGGSDREFVDPRLNEGVLRRLARASGGRYVAAAEASSVADWLDAAVPQTADPVARDLWHHPSVYAFLIALLSAEWVLRRRWGLR